MDQKFYPGQQWRWVDASSGVFNNGDKRALWLTTYASGSVPGVAW